MEKRGDGTRASCVSNGLLVFLLAVVTVDVLTPIVVAGSGFDEAVAKLAPKPTFSI